MTRLNISSRLLASLKEVNFMAVGRILVTGGAGFIGSHLAEQLYASGHRITILDDLSSGHLHNNIYKSAVRTCRNGAANGQTDVCMPCRGYNLFA